MKKLMLSCLSMLCMVGALTSCDNYSKSDYQYWFKSVTKEFVAYNEETNNIDESGTIWTFENKNACDVTCSLRIDVDKTYSAAYLYVNDVQVKSDEAGFYTYSYQLSLSKGDTIKLHAFWVNSLVTNDTGFTISVFTWNDGTGNYLLELGDLA